MYWMFKFLSWFEHHGSTRVVVVNIEDVGVCGIKRLHDEVFPCVDQIYSWGQWKEGDYN